MICGAGRDGWGHLPQTPLPGASISTLINFFSSILTLFAAPAATARGLPPLNPIRGFAPGPTLPGAAARRGGNLTARRSARCAELAKSYIKCAADLRMCRRSS